MTYQIVAAGDAAPYLTRASWSKQKQLAISSNPSSIGYGVSFSPDGSLCAVAHANSPFLTVYNTSDWSKVAISSVLPNTGYGVSFSPDGSLCAVAHASSPFLTVYNTSDWSKVAISSGIPNNGNGVSFSPDGSLCAVAHYSSPNLTVYNTSDWSKVAISSNPPSTGNGVSFSPDGSLCAVAHASSPNLTVYNTSDWSKVEHPFSVLPASANLRAVAFHAPSHSVIRGSVRDVDNNPAARTGRIYERSTGEICSTTTSDPVTGDYSAKVYEGDVDYDAHFLTAPGELLNDLFFARVRAGAP